MFGNSLFGKSLDIQQRILGVDSLRKEVIADNIANVDTPQFKRKMVSFESELNRALDSETAESVPTNRTESRHFDFNERKDWRGVQSRIQVEYDTNYRNDKNNVDIEKEMGDEVKNTLHYQALTQAISGSFRRLRSVFSQAA
ncbi:MAG: flagellar basal body rod protein FlgB [Spirochaetes bacterium]|nr:flagellar basal body rod protein FlgB [Spirochaetota bacterium]